jgi:citrate synthase
MGDLKKNRVVGNLGDPKLPYDYTTRPYGTVAKDTTRPGFQWLSEVAYKNKHRIVARGYDTTELMEAGYGLVDMQFVDFQSRIPLIEEEKMLNYIMILTLEDGLSLPAMLARTVARSKTFLTQACGASILAFGHAYGAYSAFGNMLIDALDEIELDGSPVEKVAMELAKEHMGDPALGVSGLTLKDPAAKRMFARAEVLGVSGKYIAFTKEIVKAVQQISSSPVDLDMLGAIGATMMDLGFTPEATWAILAITRSFGAGAHYIEEVEREEMTALSQELTPKEFYDGPKDRPVPPLEDRVKNAKTAQTFDLDAWKQAFEERKKLHGSGFAIVEEVEDPSEKT